MHRVSRLGSLAKNATKFAYEEIDSFNETGKFGGMKAHNFSKKVRQRSQRIVTESMFRAQQHGEKSANEDESRPVTLLRSLFRRLPVPVQQTIQSLVSDDAQIEHVRRLLRQAHEHRRELNERESLLERQVREVQSERQSLQK